MARSVSRRGRGRRTAASCGSRRAGPYSTGTGTTGPSPDPKRTDLIPVDLNSLLYHAERMIAALRTFRGRAGDADVARQFAEAAEDRRRALLAAAFDPASGFFYDVRWRSGERVTDRPTLAAASPLYFGLATPEPGRVVPARLEREFMKP